ncbi:predicted membrane protein [Longilinea arvoryzae]|uniref:Predicted membrane protein n=1 Tax=Longilinea arvoryzae TaxID=360412 RepID=A0A0K8MY06_9CHLR|nr:MBOAT family O-acyltransferase [Longilinea arvoryzae]GAP16090.1 predicted membrane protein [Longilinea arvoryzae]
MGLTHILAFGAAILLARLIFHLRPAAYPRAWGWLLLVASALAIFWLQPAVPIRNFDFYFPVATLALATLCWAVTAPPETRRERENWIAGVALAGTVLLVALTRYLSQTGLLTPSRPPQTLPVLVVLAAAALLTLLLVRFTRPTPRILTAGILVLVLVFVLLKTPALAQWSAAGLRALMGQEAALAQSTDLRWLGFSYVAFRLIHTLRDRATRRLPAVTLREYLTYAIFFPAFTAGPIDRLERFIKDLRAPAPLASADLANAGRRLLTGLFQKFVLADALALVALSPTAAAQSTAPGWLWLMLLAYSLQIYFDFAGYTDIAIGLGLLLGIRLPENFNHPYRKPSLTQFWNNWHMTLTQWFRAYAFNPLTRALRSNGRLPVWSIVLITQLATMTLIGLWHGVTPGFVIWGVWHGLGLFANNRWSDWIKSRACGRPAVAAALNASPIPATVQRLLAAALPPMTTALTFVYVSLGWVWFALPDPALAGRTLMRLFGLG